MNSLLSVARADAITLLSFFVALSKLDAPLPERLIPDVNAIGVKLADYQPCVVECIRTLLTKHEPLARNYRTARSHLNKKYPAIDGKTRPGEPEDDGEPPYMLYLVNNLPRFSELLQESNPQAALKKQQESAEGASPAGDSTWDISVLPFPM